LGLMIGISTSQKRYTRALPVALPYTVDLANLVFFAVLQHKALELCSILEEALIPEVIVNIFGGKALQLSAAVNDSLNSVIDIVELPQGIGPLCELHRQHPHSW
jgi:hypothetical protein